MKKNLIGLWHFDENNRHVANNALENHPPLLLHGAGRTNRRFGQALELRLAGDRATGKGLGRLLCGSICFWAQINGGRGQVDLINLQGMIQLTVDLSQGMALIASAEDRVLQSKTRLTPGQWHHITLTFNADGLALYLDAQKVAISEQPFAGLSVANACENYLQLGPLPPASQPVGIDELALFNIELAPAHIHDLLQGVLEPTSPQPVIHHPAQIDATQYIDHEDPTCGLQKAIDALGPAGGIVQIPMGRYLLRQSLKLPSQTALKGTGLASTLMASPPVSSQLMMAAKAGVDHVQVEDTSLFEVGDDVMIANPQQMGFGATHTQITRIDKQLLWFDQPLIADYDANAPTMVCHWFSLITALGQSHVRICDLHFLGNRNAIGDTPFGPDQACCAIQLMGAEHCQLKRLMIEDWAHDGIGLFNSRYCHISQCNVRNSLGHGIHIGDQSIANWVEQNHCQHNSGMGIFLAAQALPCIISQNILTYNIKGTLASMSQGHMVKANLAPPGNSNSGTLSPPPAYANESAPETDNTMRDVLVPDIPLDKLPSLADDNEIQTYSNDPVNDIATDLAASLNENSVSRRLRGLDAFD